MGDEYDAMIQWLKEQQKKETALLAENYRLTTKGRELKRQLEAAAFDTQDRIGGYIERIKELEKEKIEGIARDVLQAKVIDTYSEQVKQLEAKAPTLLYETLEMAHKVITEFWKPSDDPEHEEENTAIANALSTIALVLQGDRR